ncbi:MAG TPA: NAD(P)H-binding protein [Solirubrobacteraceae bacterium]|jgi:uncharacterized protein YbjT (DUF2867 family)
MAEILVTGGTGALGRRLAPVLIERGHGVRLLARHPERGTQGAETVRGDVLTGEGLPPALAGIDVVIHAATSSRRRIRETEVEGTRNVVDAIGSSGTHLIYVSIVGIDRHRLPYYRAKLEAERVISASRVPWTIQRATQFHDLLEMLLGYPVFVSTANMSFQPVDPGEVSVRLAELAEAAPAGRAPDFGGPEIRGIKDLARARRQITSRNARLIPMPRVGPLADFDRGLQLAPEHRDGRITWEEWLRASPHKR